MRRIFVYGSLRPGMYNADRIRSMNHISTHKIKGYNLYSLGSYPGIIKGDGEITVDLVEVNDSDYSSIDDMEIGAGYNSIQVTVDGQEGTLYPFKGNIYPEDLVPNGDWVDYVTKKERF